MIYFDKELMTFHFEKPIEKKYYDEDLDKEVITYKENLYEITEEEFNDIRTKIESGKYNLKLDENGKPYAEYSNELSKEELRIKREPLLKAYDTYKTAYLYGDIQVSEEEKLEISNWYQGILNLAEYFYDNIPPKIKYYL